MHAPSLRALCAAAAIPKRVVDALASGLAALNALATGLDDVDLFSERVWDPLVRGISPFGGLEPRIVRRDREPLAGDEAARAASTRPRETARSRLRRTPTVATVPLSQSQADAVAAVLERARPKWERSAGLEGRSPRDAASPSPGERTRRWSKPAQRVQTSIHPRPRIAESEIERAGGRAIEVVGHPVMAPIDQIVRPADAAAHSFDRRGTISTISAADARHRFEARATSAASRTSLDIPRGSVPATEAVVDLLRTATAAGDVRPSAAPHPAADRKRDGRPNAASVPIGPESIEPAARTATFDLVARRLERIHPARVNPDASGTPSWRARSDTDSTRRTQSRPADTSWSPAARGLRGLAQRAAAQGHVPMPLPQPNPANDREYAARDAAAERGSESDLAEQLDRILRRAARQHGIDLEGLAP